MTTGDEAPADGVRGTGVSFIAVRTTCVVCHGQAGEGGVGPTFAGVVGRLPDVGDHMEIVRSGRGTMPSFGPLLTEAEIEAVVAYEREVLDAG